MIVCQSTTKIYHCMCTQPKQFSYLTTIFCWKIIILINNFGVYAHICKTNPKGVLEHCEWVIYDFKSHQFVLYLLQLFNDDMLQKHSCCSISKDWENVAEGNVGMLCKYMCPKGGLQQVSQIVSF